MNILELPEEILVHIFSFCDNNKNLYNVCNRFRYIILNLDLRIIKRYNKLILNKKIKNYNQKYLSEIFLFSDLLKKNKTLENIIIILNYLKNYKLYKINEIIKTKYKISQNEIIKIANIYYENINLSSNDILKILYNKNLNCLLFLIPNEILDIIETYKFNINNHDLNLINNNNYNNLENIFYSMLDNLTTILKTNKNNIILNNKNKWFKFNNFTDYIFFINKILLLHKSELYLLKNIVTQNIEYKFIY